MNRLYIIYFIFITAITLSCNENNDYFLASKPGEIIKMEIDKRVDSISYKKNIISFITSEKHWAITNAWNILRNDTLKFENPFIGEGTRSNILKTGFADIYKEGKILKIDISENTNDVKREILVELNGVGLKTEYIKVIQNN